MTVAEDVTTTTVAEDAIQVNQEEKEILLQDAKADSEVTEVRLPEKVMAEEVNPEVQETGASLTKLQDVMAVLLKDQ